MSSLHPHINSELNTIIISALHMRKLRLGDVKRTYSQEHSKLLGMCGSWTQTQPNSRTLHFRISAMRTRSTAAAPSISVMPEKSEVSHLAWFMVAALWSTGTGTSQLPFYVKPGKLALMKQSEALSHLSPRQSWVWSSRWQGRALWKWAAEMSKQPIMEDFWKGLILQCIS